MGQWQRVWWPSSEHGGSPQGRSIPRLATRPQQERGEQRLGMGATRAAFSEGWRGSWADGSVHC